MYLKNKDKKDCAGCSACSSICSQNAITMQSDDCGFKYPVINKELCIDCGLCEKICIFDKKAEKAHFNTKFYAVCNKDADVVKKSSSGGMLTLMSEEIFARGGVVYGVIYGENFTVEHSRAENMEEAKAFRTSKYVQSDIDKLYISVKKDLMEERVVLVTGTPCQIAGLKDWLKYKGTDTTNLYTCDNICHGVSSPLTFSDYLSCLKKYIPEDDRIISINMRHKKEKGSKTTLEICAEKTGVISEVEKFSYYRLFLNRIANRPSCFNCRFTNYNRPGDLSVADFWNASDSDFSFDASHGVNEVLVNSTKGQELFNSICKNANYEEVSKEKAWQPHLEYATSEPKNYHIFWDEYLKSDNPEQVLRKYLKVSPLFKIINFAIPILRKTGLYSFCGKLYKKVFVKKS